VSKKTIMITVVAALSALFFFLAGRSFATFPGRVEQIRLQTQFSTLGYSLSIRGPSKDLMSFPPGMEEALIYEGKKTRIIQNVLDLEGTVIIHDAVEALQYVRLGSSPRTFHLFKSFEVEPIVVRDIDSTVMYGDMKWLDELVASGCSRSGVIFDSEVPSWYVKARVVKDESRYRIYRRLLCRKPDGNVVLRDLCEEVDRSGNVKREYLSALSIRLEDRFVLLTFRK